VRVELGKYFWPCLGLFGAVTLASCGGTDDGRPTQGTPAPVILDLGSQQVVCEVTDQFEFATLADFELGSVTGGWYFNNDQCDKCQKALDRIKEINNAFARVGSLTVDPVDKNGCVVADDVVQNEWHDKELPQLNVDIEKGNAAKNIPPRCRDVCEASQTPSAFIKPLPADRLNFNGKDQPRCGSKYAMHVKGGPFQTWGGVFAVQLGNPGLDAANWEGISFWARVGPQSRHPLRIELSDPRTDDKQKVYQGQLLDNPTADQLAEWCKTPQFVCNGDSVRDDTNGCDKFGANRSMTTDWQFFAVDFALLRQSGWGQKSIDENGALAGLDSGDIRSINFLWTTGEWDVWIDDIALYRRKKP